MSREVRIFQPAKNAMQSGKAKSHCWVISFKPTFPILKDALVGWSGSQDMQEELQLHFQTLEDAIAYVEAKSWSYTVEKLSAHNLQPKSYADNFTLGRIR